MILPDTGFLFAFVSEEDKDHSRVDAVLELEDLGGVDARAVPNSTLSG